MLSIALRVCCIVMNYLFVHFQNTNENICVIGEVEIENEDDCSTLTEKGKHTDIINL